MSADMDHHLHFGHVEWVLWHFHDLFEPGFREERNARHIDAQRVGEINPRASRGDGCWSREIHPAAPTEADFLGCIAHVLSLTFYCYALFTCPKVSRMLKLREVAEPWH